MRPWSTAALVPVMFSIACGFLNPAGTAFEEGQDLAAKGEYMEAIEVYAKIEKEWPDSPEAAQVPGATDDAFVGWVGKQMGEGNYGDIHGMWKFVETRDLGARLPEGAPAANLIGQAMTTGADSEGTVALVAEAIAMKPPEKTAADIKTWACEHIEEFPEAKSCLDTEGAVKARADACGAVEPVATMCEDNKLGAAMEDAETALAKWATEERAYIRERLAPTKELADVCEKTKRDTVRLMERALRSETQAAIFWMICTRGNKNALNNQMCRDVQDFKAEWSVNFARLGGLAMRDEYSKECRDHIDAALVKMLEGCTKKSAPQETRWILDLPLEKCPG